MSLQTPFSRLLKMPFIVQLGVIAASGTLFFVLAAAAIIYSQNNLLASLKNQETTLRKTFAQSWQKTLTLSSKTSQLAQYQAQLELLQKSLPQRATTNDLLRNITNANQQQLNLSLLKPKQKQTDSTPAIDINLVAGYPDAISFMNNLARLSPNTSIGDLQIEANCPQLKVRATLAIHSFAK